jgi:hypothetical protein
MNFLILKKIIIKIAIILLSLNLCSCNKNKTELSVITTPNIQIIMDNAIKNAISNYAMETFKSSMAVVDSFTICKNTICSDSKKIIIRQASFNFNDNNHKQIFVEKNVIIIQMDLSKSQEKSENDLAFLHDIRQIKMNLIQF